MEVQTPIPKVYPPTRINQLRNISGLLNLDTVTEKIFRQMIYSDMKNKMDPAQYGNQRGMSIQHYLIDMIHRILTAVDENSSNQINAKKTKTMVFNFTKSHQFDTRLHIENEKNRCHSKYKIARNCYNK